MDEEIYNYEYNRKHFVDIETKKKYFLRALRLLRLGTVSNFQKIYWDWVYQEGREFYHEL